MAGGEADVAEPYAMARFATAAVGPQAPPLLLPLAGPAHRTSAPAPLLGSLPVATIGSGGTGWIAGTPLLGWRIHAATPRRAALITAA